jgi:hypothetical protein
MVDEIKAVSALRLVNGLRYFEQPQLYTSIDQTGTGIFTNEQNVGFAAHEVLTLPSWASTLGACTIRNLDDTNFVQIGVDVAAAFYPTMKLKPGEIFVLRLVPSVVYYAKADTAAVDILYTILED